MNKDNILINEIYFFQNFKKALQFEVLFFDDHPYCTVWIALSKITSDTGGIHLASFIPSRNPW